MLSHQIILHPDTPFTSSFTPYERKMGFSWYLCPATVAGEQEWLLVNGEFGYVELVDTCDAEAIEQAVLDVIEQHLPDGKDNVSVSFDPEHISWHTADKMPEHVALRYQQALKLLGNHEDATDELDQLNDTPLTLGGRTFAPSEGLDGLLQELADDFRHYIETTPWWKLQWHLWTRKRPWLASLTTEN